MPGGLARIASLVAVVLIAGVLTSAAGQARNVALVIGNSRYEAPGVTHLRNPVNDARAVAERLQGLGFEVLLKEDQKLADLNHAFREFSVMADGANVALLYFAGHGIEIDRRNYLIPVDARLRRARDVTFETIDAAQAIATLDGARQLRVVVLDACRDNPFAKQMRRRKGKRNIGRGLARINTAGEQTLIAYAAAEGTTADDGAGLHSPFTNSFLRHVATPGLEVRLMFGRIRDDVLKATNDQQEPFIYGSLGGKEIYLAGRGDAAAPPPAAPPPAVVAPQPVPQSDASRHWAEIKSLNSPAIFETFARQYPGTFYAALAEARARELRERQRPRNQPQPQPPRQNFANLPPAEETEDFSEVEQRALRFVRDVHLPQGPSGLDRYVRRHFARTVSYYGKRYSRSRVLRDKKRYFAKFRSWQIDLVPGSFRAERTSSDRILARFSIDYAWYPRRSSQRVKRGRAAVEFLMEEIDGRFVISSENSRRLN